MATNDQTYMGLIALRDKLDAKHTELKRELEIVSKQLDSVSTTLELLEDAPSVHQIRTPDAETSTSATPIGMGVDVAGLHGMTQLEALRKIAEHGGGVFYTTFAKQVLLSAGLIKNPKNANNIIFGLILKSGAFERLGPGHYRLINKPIKPARPQQSELL